MKFSAIIAVAGLTAGIQGCFLTVHSSTVGNFNVFHSEPLDHNGARQYVNFSKGGCNIKGELLNGCTVKTSSVKGCGSISWSITHPGRFARNVEVIQSSEE